MRTRDLFAKLTLFYSVGVFITARRYAYKRGTSHRPVSVCLSVRLAHLCIIFKRLKISLITHHMVYVQMSINELK